jgi:hypothetical protein
MFEPFLTSVGTAILAAVLCVAAVNLLFEIRKFLRRDKLDRDRRVA